MINVAEIFEINGFQFKFAFGSPFYKILFNRFSSLLDFSLDLYDRGSDHKAHDNMEVNFDSSTSIRIIKDGNLFLVLFFIFIFNIQTANTPWYTE
jgi:hypothetical protein